MTSKQTEQAAEKFLLSTVFHPGLPISYTWRDVPTDAERMAGNSRLHVTFGIENVERRHLTQMVVPASSKSSLVWNGESDLIQITLREMFMAYNDLRDELLRDERRTAR